MAQRIVAVVLGIVGLYLNIWHTSPLPFDHYSVFGRGFGEQHSLHAFIGLVLIAAAVWLWLRARNVAARA